MKKTTEEAIERVYLFTGEVDARRDIEVNRIVDSLIDPDFRTFDLEQMSGDSVSATDIISAATTIPMGSKRRVVIVDKIERLLESEQANLASNLQRLSEMSCLILLSNDNSKPKKAKKLGAKASSIVDDLNGGEEETPEADAAPKSSGKGISSKLSNAVKANGRLINYAKMRGLELKPLILQFVKACGKSIEPSALELLGRYLEPNPSTLEKEIEKLATYIGDRESITESDVNEMVEKPDEDRVFPLIDAIASAQPGKAAQLLSETLAASSKPDQDVLKTISLLARHFRILYQTLFLNAEAKNSRLDQDEAIQFLMKEHSPIGMQGWQQDKLNAQSKSFTKKELQWCMKQILECELSVKGIGKWGGTPRLNLETLILKLSLRRRSRI